VVVSMCQVGRIDGIVPKLLQSCAARTALCCWVIACQLQVHLCGGAASVLQLHHRQAAAPWLDRDMLWDAEFAVQRVDVLADVCCCSTKHG
jgi:hypothetical protein